MELSGVILGYRRGSNTQYTSEVLALVRGVSGYKEACRLIGKKAVYVDEHGNTYHGKVVGVHGRKGVVRIVFKPNLPGQAIGKEFRLKA